MTYETQTPISVHDNEWYWARAKYNYMDHYGQWRAIQNKIADDIEEMELSRDLKEGEVYQEGDL